MKIFNFKLKIPGPIVTGSTHQAHDVFWHLEMNLVFITSVGLPFYITDQIFIFNVC